MKCTEVAMLCALLVAGCAAHVDAGYAYRSPDAAPRVLRAGGRVVDMRQSGPTLGLQGTGTIDSDRFSLRNAMVGVGYQARPIRPPIALGVEGSLQLGMGEPVFIDYDGVGGYVGAQLLLPVRLIGNADFDENNYYTLAVLVDLVASGNIGVWTPPIGADTATARGDGGAALGIQVTFGSDAGRAPTASLAAEREATP